MLAGQRSKGTLGTCSRALCPVAFPASEHFYGASRRSLLDVLEQRCPRLGQRCRILVITSEAAAASCVCTSIDRVGERELSADHLLVLTDRHDIEGWLRLIPPHQRERLVRSDKYREAHRSSLWLPNDLRISCKRHACPARVPLNRDRRVASMGAPPGGACRLDARVRQRARQPQDLGHFPKELLGSCSSSGACAKSRSSARSSWCRRELLSTAHSSHRPSRPQGPDWTSGDSPTRRRQGGSQGTTSTSHRGQSLGPP
jgi:hypothetical protein